jgi:large subunit ribosomal protein L22
MGKNAQERGNPRRTRIEQRRAEGVAVAVARNIRVSPLKLRRIIDLIRGKDYPEALAILNFTPSPSVEPVRKVLQSAAANAENNLSLDPDRLYVKTCYVDAGLSFKRMHPTTMGRARVIRRRSSHITVLVAERARARTARAAAAG